jgi:uncharacterized protein YndB with AHSA1/START domain
MSARRNETEAVLEHELRVAASPDTVFDYFTDPAKMAQWIGEATLDPRPGGVCRVSPCGHATMLGEYVEIDRPRKVTFTWGWEEVLFATPPQSTLVEVSLTPDGEDTIVRLAHRRLKPEAVAFHRVGWDHYLARLRLAGSGKDPGIDPWMDLDRNVEDLRAARVFGVPELFVISVLGARRAAKLRAVARRIL